MLNSNPTFALVAVASVAFMTGPSHATADLRTGPPSTSEPNSPPDGVSDQYETLQDQTITVDAPGVLANDSDPDGDSISVSRNEQALDGVLTMRASGAFQYTPDPGFAGFDQFHYAVEDGQGNEDLVEVHILVRRVRPTTTTTQAPIATVDLGSESEPPVAGGPAVDDDQGAAESEQPVAPTVADPDVTTTSVSTGTLPATGSSSSVLVVAGAIVALGAGAIVTALGTAATEGLRRSARPGPRNRRR